LDFKGKYWYVVAMIIGVGVVYLFFKPLKIGLENRKSNKNHHTKNTVANSPRVFS